jgi:phage tail P2-like protein
MKLENLNIRELLPLFMRDDAAIRGFYESLNPIFSEPAKNINSLKTWNQIDCLSDGELDELAREMGVFWYIDSSKIEIKRQILKFSDEVFAHLGTKYAVDQVISAYFGAAVISEWFEYGGEPGYFRVFVSNAEVTGEIIEQFRRTLKQIKRTSAWLEYVQVILTEKAGIKAHVAAATVGKVVGIVEVPNV